MLKRLLFAGLVLFASGLAAGCSDGSPPPFEGDWVSSSAGRLSFHGDKWSDGDGDSGKYGYSGKYPDFSVVFKSDAGQFAWTAEFCDVNTFVLCRAGVSSPDATCSQDAPGPAADCHRFVIDKPTLH